ncbi:MAG TPA: thiol peroxidase [Candidatus Hydrogenedentes bacterium]|nr:thiol peroxidase [Candidatus Hydrogenedentota bacterium]HPC17473.1 thiol peroxidase [Candidatus Hydrogenedentota bacterium]HRT20065.1 thiol peroxidase [Candidatus Hydrogenedentota bacterium]HRT64871.1 thiol peroxidase [Candidatus Hydrogenedentota bacterium]
MMERPGDVTFQGNPLTAIGPRLKPGSKAPDFQLLANDLSVVTLSDSAGKIRLVSVVPSLDTPVCDTQTRRFNEQMDEWEDRVAGYTVSADLPFAQARWCGTAGIKRMQTLSDHRDMAFGSAYGTHIKELRLESRAVFVIDGNDFIQYVEYVKEITQHPDYAAALDAVKRLVEA